MRQLTMNELNFISGGNAVDDCMAQFDQSSDLGVKIFNIFIAPLTCV